MRKAARSVTDQQGDPEELLWDDRIRVGSPKHAGVSAGAKCGSPTTSASSD